MLSSMKKNNKKVGFCAIPAYIIGVAGLLSPVLSYAVKGSHLKSLKEAVLSSEVFKSTNLNLIRNDKGIYRFADPMLFNNKVNQEIWTNIGHQLNVQVDEWYKVRNKQLTLQQIVLGTLIYEYSQKHRSELDDNEYLFALKQSADHGSESAIKDLLNAYRFQKFGLSIQNPEVLKEGRILLENYADQGSEEAVKIILLDIFEDKPLFGPIIQPGGSKILKYYTDRGSLVAIEALYASLSNDITGEYTNLLYLADERLKLILEEYANHGNEKAITLILKGYQRGWFGLDSDDLAVKRELLRLAKQYVSDGSSYALELLLTAYQLGHFGLDAKDPIVQQEGLRFAREFAEKGSEYAIERLLISYRYGYYGLNVEDVAIQKEGLKVAREFAEKGSEEAITILIQAFRFGHFGLNAEDAEVQVEGLRLVKEYAKNSKSAMEFLAGVCERGGFGLRSGDPSIRILLKKTY